MMTLPKLPTTSSQISEANKIRKNGQLSTSDWLLQDSKSKFSTSLISPLSSGINSMENSFPKMSTESSSSNFSEEYFSPKKNAYHRSVNAYYKHIERFNLERTQSLSNLAKPTRSGRPSILKPLKLWKPVQGKEKMVWVYGNPWSETDPRYLRTGSGQMTKLEERILKVVGKGKDIIVKGMIKADILIFP